jgi:hypothetical protein
VDAVRITFCSKVISESNVLRAVRVSARHPPPFAAAKENRMPDAIARTLPAEEAVSEIATLLARGYQRHLHEATSQSIKTNEESFEGGLAMQPDQSVHASGGRRNTPPSAPGESKQGVDA